MKKAEKQKRRALERSEIKKEKMNKNWGESRMDTSRGNEEKEVENEK